MISSSPEGVAIKVAVVGCGAIATSQHVPAIAGSDGAQIACLVDASLNQARKARDLYGLECRMVTDLRDALGEIDVAIIATPTAYHAEQAIACLEAGVHVLCEKPMAASVADCQRMVDAAENNGRVLAIGHMQRFYPSTRTVKALLEHGELGVVRSVRVERGVRFRWATASGFYFDRALSAGGVVLDAGCHALDRLIHWFGQPEVVSYEDDSLGGVEANAAIQLRFQHGASKVEGTAVFSRTHPLPHRIQITGSEGAALVDDESPEVVTVVRALGSENVVHRILPTAFDPRKAGVAQWDDFLRSVRTGSAPMCSGRDATAVVSLIQHCYANVRPLHLPWVTYHTKLTPA